MIGFDLDGVLVDTLSEFKRSAKILYDVDFDPSKQKQFAFDINLNQREIGIVLDHCIAQYNHIPIYDGVSNLLTDVFNLIKRPIKIVTNRTMSQASNTYKLVDRFCNAPYELIINHCHYPKNTFLKSCAIFVEDRRKNAIELEKAGYYVFLVDRPWNQFDISDKRICRVDNVTDILDRIPLSVFSIKEKESTDEDY